MTCRKSTYVVLYSSKFCARADRPAPLADVCIVSIGTTPTSKQLSERSEFIDVFRLLNYSHEIFSVEFSSYKLVGRLFNSVKHTPLRKNWVSVVFWRWQFWMKMCERYRPDPQPPMGVRTLGRSANTSNGTDWGSATLTFTLCFQNPAQTRNWSMQEKHSCSWFHQLYGMGFSHIVVKWVLVASW